MPLPEPKYRKPRHTRNISFQGYERDDGLWDIEGHITDIKSDDFVNFGRGLVPAGTPIHDMWIRVTVNLDREVVSVVTAIDSAPYDICATIEPAFKALEGLTVGPGWTRKVKELLGGRNGCTHVVEILGPLATAVLQTLYPAMRAREEANPPAVPQRPFQLDGCHTLASNGEVAKVRWPDFYTED